MLCTTSLHIPWVQELEELEAGQKLVVRTATWPLSVCRYLERMGAWCEAAKAFEEG